MASVRLEQVVKRYGNVTVVDGVDLSIQKGEFVTLLGASGSGKTTCLRMIAGFVSPTSGRIFIEEKDVTRTPPHRRNTGMVFQQYALFPHLTVAENVAFGLKIRRLAKAEVTEQTREALQLVHLDKLGDRYPSQLSGGQRQRVALARAVVIRPRVLLMDEPLAALDLKLREELQTEIKRVQEVLGITTIFVTHDQNEALGLSDRIVVMRDGRILQVDSPSEIYRRPETKYVASFVGRMNFLDAKVVRLSNDGAIHLEMEGNGKPLEVRGHKGPLPQVGERSTVAFRPECGRIDNAEHNSLEVQLDKKNYSGSEWTLACRGPSDSRFQITVPQSDRVPDIGAAFNICWSSEQCILLPHEAAQ